MNEIDIEKAKVKVTVDMFGRETKMELDFRTSSVKYRIILLSTCLYRLRFKSVIISKVRLSFIWHLIMIIYF